MIAEAMRALAGRALVWDLDGTLFDPRPRMLATVRSFGVDAALDDVRPTWQATARALALDADAFHAHWDQHFWDAAAFALDEPIAETIWYARWAQSIGIENVVVTGRVEENRDATLAQLARVALTPAKVIMKPAIEHATPRFKAEQIRALTDAGAFITDSQDEIEAVRALLPHVQCVLFAPRETVEREQPLLPGGYALSPWIVHEVAREMGRDLSNVVVEGPIHSRAQLEQQLGRDAFAVFERVRRIACEHFLNDREGRARVCDGDLDPAFARGALFSLPVVRERARVEVRSTCFDPPPAYPGLPLHPQEAVHHDVDTILEVPVRATASGRTVLAPEVLLKCDLSHVFMDRHRRSLTLRDAELAVRNSDFLARRGLAFFPEALAVADRARDIACIYRSPTPHPAGEADSYSIPAFCLFAPAHEFAAEPLARRFFERGVLIDRVVLPLMDAMLALTLDVGCAFLGHGQNIYVEIGGDGLPTGRVVFADMEDLWPHPELAPDYPADDAYRAAHARSPEADIAGTFQDYFLWKLMHPLLSAAPSPAPRRAATERLVDEVRRRPARVRSHPALSWFSQFL